jgi:hypothetical protein
VTGAILLLARDTFSTLVRRRTNIVLLLIAFWLLIMVSCSLRVTGMTIVDGQAVPVDDAERLKLAIGSAFAGIHFLGFLSVLFVLAPAIFGELESGLAAWTWTKPVTRASWICGRALGAFLFVVALSGLVVAGLELLLSRHAGSTLAAPIVGWLVLLVLFAAYIAIVVAIGVHIGGNMASLVLLLLALLGVFVDVDALTRRFLLGGAGAAAAPGFFDMLLAPLFGGGQAPLLGRVLYGAAYILVPGTGNVHDIAVAKALSSTVPVPLDWISLAIAVAAVPASLAVAARRLARREI